MNIQPTSLNFGILTKPPVKKFYAPKCWNEISEGAYKDYTFTIYNNYEFGDKGSTLIILRKAGSWILSKLKYTENGKKKTIWSYK